MYFADRMNRLGTEKAFEVGMEVDNLRRQGKDIISFGAGEPDFNSPEHVKAAGTEAINNNDTHYTVSSGTLEFRQSVADHIAETRGAKIDPEEVIATPGAKSIICYSVASCVNPGDEVIYPNPGYPIYPSMINFFGATAVPLPLLEEMEFRFSIDDLKSRITGKTRMLIINSPQNPTGSKLTKQDLEEIAELAVKHDLWVLSDEIYGRINYDAKPGVVESIFAEPGMRERTIILDGHSKIYAMTGWRLGYAVICNKELMEHFTRLVINFNACVSGFTLKAGQAALTGSQKSSENMVNEFRARRDLIVDGLNSIPGVKCHRPHGAFYVFPNVTECCRMRGFKDALDLQKYLLYEGGIAVLARIFFGEKNAEEKQEYIRLSYATSRELITQGLKRMKHALEDEEKIRNWLKSTSTPGS
ncbi:MAG: pyridoxal phosphate-dependent aminotransferase [Deltaproteobacteria bacterium]|nr:pyridoxal phosphate-dependent aminotransferase [Deltaproteobacteria bacterium]MBW1961156.1 pyridoxal phosphate-dependent aminotransferase [Deltaproteobacteria bacterium]MBW1995296.1 pyridoxal phosphate-dependent aminotransferase [Deltaproteobacteria bacterium]MBW2150256.1 pyridoxal phosphate-dependent aminotransferase [Deltaproteobacteria bacterium]